MKQFMTLCFGLFLVCGSAMAQLTVKNGGRVYIGGDWYFTSSADTLSPITQGPGGLISPASVNGSGLAKDLKLNISGGMNVVGNISADKVMAAYFINASSYPSFVESPSFYVTAGGQVYARNGYAQSSDLRFKENVTPLISVLGKIDRLKGVSFSYKPQVAAEMSSVNGAVAQQRIGLLAQDVEKVFPEAVVTLEDGSKGVYYGDLVGVLVEAVKELKDSLEVQNEKMDLLMQQVNLLAAAGLSQGAAYAPTETLSLDDEIKTEASLSQNVPNPFSGETRIDYVLPDGVTNASIAVYDFQGVQVRKIDLSDSHGYVLVDLSGMQAGLYIYSLIADGNIVASKMMALED